jgi:hypothetical protein
VTLNLAHNLGCTPVHWISQVVSIEGTFVTFTEIARVRTGKVRRTNTDGHFSRMSLCMPILGPIPIGSPMLIIRNWSILSSNTTRAAIMSY